MVSDALKKLYSTTFSQAYSPDEALLALGNKEGEITIFDLKNVNQSREGGGGERLRRPFQIVNGHNDAIYSMVSTPDFCITGSTGVIAGRRWSDLRKMKTQTAWTIALESDQSNFGTPEINSLAYDEDRGLVYAACGDWKTHAYDLESGKRTMSFEGHDDYVHDVVISGNTVASCGEDGAVLVWDGRTGRDPCHKLTPHTHDQLQRPNIGRFLTSLHLNNDWLVCGGGPKAGVFHLRSLALTTVLPPSSSAVHFTKFTDNTQDGAQGGIVVAGATPRVFVCSLAGDVTAEIQSSSPCIYTVHIINKPYTLMTMGGMSSKMDVCFNLNYRDHVVSLVED
ncbi:unnamed protein product [Meganyctiphanes norvegica]|uniref:THO complex subunit 6 n=1 Tax=Meganyctiphanes norvegica TaxID=48144 RepID=A0AAV2QQG0_MEGNR